VLFRASNTVFSAARLAAPARKQVSADATKVPNGSDRIKRVVCLATKRLRWLQPHLKEGGFGLPPQGSAELIPLLI
jgi:hypothetical protein